eukprot:3069576-Alexandrium_andersonii.AAC.1
MSASLVGSEMCIRDRQAPGPALGPASTRTSKHQDRQAPGPASTRTSTWTCLLYTSDAADDM